MSEQTYIDIDALLEELRNLPPPTETYAFFTETEPGRAFVSDQLYAIFNGFLAHFFTPDITTYVSTCESLIPVLDLALLTAKTVLDILELADVMFDKFVSVSLTLQQHSDPQHIVPTHSIVRTCLLDIIPMSRVSARFKRHRLYVSRAFLTMRACLMIPPTAAELQTLKSNIQEREDQAKTALFAAKREDIPAAALEIVAQGCTSTGPAFNEVLPTTTAQLRRNSSMIMETLRASKSTRPLGASQSLPSLATSVSRPIVGLPKRGAPLSRTQSLSAMLPPQAQARVLNRAWDGD
ncbi:hypothetical protein EDB19DRAFT_1941527 [Suillus lakei]|nr:hypothetical protein EDB19DRAFT_1941527 [Suillus lakei]